MENLGFIGQNAGNTTSTDTSGSNGSSFNWGSTLSSGITAGGNVLTQVLKNQALGTQASIASSSSKTTTTLIIMGVVALLGLGILFAFMGHKGK